MGAGPGAGDESRVCLNEDKNEANRRMDEMELDAIDINKKEKKKLLFIIISSAPG